MIALFVSVLAYLESRRLRREQGESQLFIDMRQTNSDIYVILYNIGHSYAYDVKVDVSRNFINKFSNLKIVQPLTAYQYILLNSHDVSKYPNEVMFQVSYRDRYSEKKPKKIEFRFLLTDYLQYDVKYNNTSHTYDINTSF